MTPEELAGRVLLECTGVDDHDSPTCGKCVFIKDQIAAVIKAAVAEERQACAKLCEEKSLGISGKGYPSLVTAGQAQGALFCAAAIRART